MLFSSIIFLCLFLPLTLIVYFFAGTKLRNIVLLIASLLFYAWGEVGYIVVLLYTILINWLCGLLLDATALRRQVSRFVLALGVAANLLPLIYFKYGNFLVENCNAVVAKFAHPGIVTDSIYLPIGISFFTFKAISYLIDVYRRDVEMQRSPLNFALYISLFPHLIAGPIVRYRDVARHIVERHISFEDLGQGIYRFVTGLGKKILIANQLGAVADHIFSLSPEGLPASLLWLGILTYTLQIYYDFSGYSDMAIGLGRMFGFHFLENFNYPYSSLSIQEFWRRWHISLSTWFRDYLYIPLGGNKKGEVRTYVNLILVFSLCGLWHGASWTFLIWGLYHGLFLALERSILGKLLNSLPVVVRAMYTFFVIMIGWIFFRSETIAYALLYIKSLVNFGKPAYLDGPLFTAMANEFYAALVFAIIFATPLFPYFKRKWEDCREVAVGWKSIAFHFVSTAIYVAFIGTVLIYGAAQVFGDSHNPFIYSRF
ncbi:MAG: MBOAT family protein [Desulforhopalus sp.]|nr:MBOAT family protein [Desulforhopalus sp.]